MGIGKEIIDFIKNPENLNLLWLILPTLTFYLTKKDVFFVISLIVLAIILVYKLDLINKKDQIIQGRIKSKKQRVIPIKKWKLTIKRANQEFKYMYNWVFFGIVNTIFVFLFVYSTIISFRYSIILFGIHLALGTFIIILYAIINFNLNKSLKKGKNENKRVSKRKRK